MEEAYCLNIFTSYVYDISDKPSTNALYFYKVAGCLNEEMQQHVAKLTGKNVKTLNTQMFYDYQKILPEISGNEEVTINIGEELETSIQDVYVEVAHYDEDEGTITYYGTDACCRFDGNGNVVATINGAWFAIDGSLLDAEYSFSTDTTSTYVAEVLHNNVPSYMTFTVDHETDEVAINSVVKIPTDEKSEYDAALRVNTELLPGDTIIPILTKQDASGQDTYTVNGTKIKYKVNSEIRLIDFPDGEYLQSVVITDLRGDKYYSPVVEAEIKNGNIRTLELNPMIVGGN